MPTPFRKTAKGQTEIETRAHRLTPRLRGLLILVDGKRDAEALAALVPQQADTLLAELLAQGFVEALPETGAPPAPPPRRAAEPRPVAETRAPPPPPATAPGRSDDFETLRRNAVRALNDELGPAAETIAIRIERTHSMAELRPLLVQAAQAVANMRGRAAAEAYAAKFLAD
ncbi:MAG: hypothetical protein Q8K45_17250 [Rubrivivax sp.]|nr:hypothetical protein [Rubrivivax sp.]